MAKYQMSADGIWWELWDSHGNILKLALRSEYSYSGAKAYFEKYCQNFEPSPCVADEGRSGA